MLYQIRNGGVQFAATTILEDINFEIRDTEKIAVVGRNGCGKTTLLKLISGEVDLAKRDSDEDIFIAKAGNPVIGYLKQNAFQDDGVTMETEVRKAFSQILTMQSQMNEMVIQMDTDSSEELIGRYTRLQEQFQYLGGYTFEKEYEVVIKQFGFTKEDKKKKLSEFSGGQRTKIAFVKMLLEKPDILLLDEPTNHLDTRTIEWLEGYLKNYPRAVVLVSHDRMFLDHVVDVVYEIEYGTAVRYPGDYTNFIKKKKENWEKQLKDYTLQKKEIARLQAIVDKFKNKPTKVAMTRSKLKAIEHMTKLEPPARYDLKSFHANFTPERESVKDVLLVNQLDIGYDRVLSQVSFTLKKGIKMGIIGENGTGKSTLLRTINGQIPALGGEYKIGGQVNIGYFEQQMAQYFSTKTVMEDFWDTFPDLTQNEVRSCLGAFMFSGDDVFKTVDMLSGGEKVRLTLSKILKRKPNFLILDEPTNHMDIVGKETLENMLKGYSGTLIFVSHDRYFVKEIADCLLIFENGKVTYFPYSYDEYMEKKAEAAEKEETEAALSQAKNNRPEETPQTMSYFNPGKEISKINRQLSKLNAKMEEIDKEIIETKAALNNPENAFDYQKLSEFTEKAEALEEEQFCILEQIDRLEEQLGKFS